MAAVRRSSDSGVFIALGIALFVALVGIGFSVWFWDQYLTVRKAVAVNQANFADTVAGEFTKHGWAMKTAAAPDQGFEYDRDSYSTVVEKLAEAAVYEKDVLPLLGWESVSGIQAALADSEAQQALVEQGGSAYGQLAGLLKYYGEQWTLLRKEVADLRAENADTESRRQALETQSREAQDKLTEEFNRVAEQYKSDIAKYRQDYNDIVAQHAAQQQAAVQWQAKYQEEANAHQREVAALERDVASWKTKYDDAVGGPGKEERMQPEGAVLVMRSDLEFVVIDGGRDKGLAEDASLVVYNLTPDGKDRKKGVIQVGEVRDHTSLATVSYETEPILAGDYYVSLARWLQFHREVAEAED